MESKRPITSVVLHYEQMNAILESFDNEKLGVITRAFFDWCFTGKEYDGNDGMIKFAFLTLKTQAKIDFAKYDVIIEKRREAGRKHTGNQYTRMKQMEQMEQVFQNGTNGTINNNDNINDNINVNVNRESIEREKKAADKSAIKKSLEERKKDFYESLVPFVDKYDRQMIRDFYNYWSQVNEGGKKMLWEMQKAFEISKRLATWNSRRKSSSQTQEESLYRNAPQDKWEQAKKEKWI